MKHEDLEEIIVENEKQIKDRDNALLDINLISNLGSKPQNKINNISIGIHKGDIYSLLANDDESLKEIIKAFSCQNLF